MSWIYPSELIEALGPLGLAPTSASPPLLVREVLNDLYRYELRRLRDRYLAHEFDKASLHERVVALRRKYWPLTLQPAAWERLCGPTSSSPQTP